MKKLIILTLLFMLITTSSIFALDVKESEENSQYLIDAIESFSLRTYYDMSGDPESVYYLFNTEFNNNPNGFAIYKYYSNYSYSDDPNIQYVVPITRTNIDGINGQPYYSEILSEYTTFCYIYNFETNTWGITNLSDYATTWKSYQLIHSFGYDSSFLNTLSPSPGFDQYFIYETETGIKIAEYYKTFPNITYVSNLNSDDYSKWKLNGSGEREVYYYDDYEEVWYLVAKSYGDPFTGYFEDREIKIISSSQEISDGINTYTSTGNEVVNTNPDSPTFFKVVSPLNNTSTIKTSVEFQVYINMPLEIKETFKTYTSSFAPRLYIESNFIENPNNINGFLPKVITELSNSPTSWWENDGNTNDSFTIINHTTKNIDGRREIIYKIKSNLNVGENRFNFSLEPQFVSLSATGASDIINKPLILQQHTIIRNNSLDSDNDNIDDNTGEDITNTDSLSNDIINPGDSTDWLNSDGSFGDEFGSSATAMLKDVFNFTKEFTGNVGQIFTFLPTEIIAIIVFSLSVGVIIGIMKMLL